MFLDILTNLTIDLINSKIKTTETYLKLKRKWLNTSLNDFEERYKEAKIEFWYIGKPKEILEFFDTKEVVEAYKQKFYKEISEEDFNQEIEKVIEQLAIGDKVKKFDIKSEIKEFDETFRKIVDNSRLTKEKELFELVKKVDKNIEKSIPYLQSEHRNLLNKFEKNKEALDRTDIFRGLCSADTTLRAYAAFYAGEYKMAEAIPLLIQNLEIADNDLILITLQALGQLKAFEAANKFVDFFNHSDQRIRGVARSSLFSLGTKAITQENLSLWLSWLSSDDKYLRHNAVNLLRALQEKGELDTESIFEYLKRLINSGDDYMCEMAYWLLSEIEGVSEKFDLRGVVNNPNEDAHVKFACLWGIFLDGDHKFAGEYLLNLLKMLDKSQGWLELQNVAALCVKSEESTCKEAVERYLEYCSKHYNLKSVSELRSIERKFTVKRVKIAPTAIGLGKTARDIEFLRKDDKFQHFIEILYKVPQYFRGRRDIALIITGDNQSPISKESVAKYLKDFEGFRIIDFREIDIITIGKYALDFKIYPKICMMLPASFHPTLSMMFYWIYETNEINLSSSSPNPEAFKLQGNSILVGVIDTEDYANIELNTGWSSNKFYRMAAPCFRF